MAILIRMLVSWGPVADPVRDRFSNTLYFTSSDLPIPDYQKLADDLRDLYDGQNFTNACDIQVRAYNMADAKPRPERAYSHLISTGTRNDSPHQVAVALSYYGDRNLPRQRGRIFSGPWNTNASLVPAGAITELHTLADGFSALGGVNIDWVVYSPTGSVGGDMSYHKITNCWVDNSWDVIRSRKLAATTRTAWTTSG